jgi:hypothetical protein
VNYFVTMLSMGMIESQMNEIEILEEEDSFNQILYYIYTGDINPIYYKNTLSVLHLWEKMNIEYRLRNLCISLIFDKMLDDDNLVDVYEYAVDSEDSVLMYACEVYASYHKDDLENKQILSKLKMNPNAYNSQDETIKLYSLEYYDDKSIETLTRNCKKFIVNLIFFLKCLKSVLGGPEVGKKYF